ncbi:MAG: hypothetical protein EP330_26640 [Deltaproteobacteria bacterium]|nr:MAG: hypothetical protein EP330_26640 [Deltaproteobacteria bacterium]
MIAWFLGLALACPAEDSTFCRAWDAAYIEAPWPTLHCDESCHREVVRAREALTDPWLLALLDRVVATKPEDIAASLTRLEALVEDSPEHALSGEARFWIAEGSGTSPCAPPAGKPTHWR